MVFDVEDAAQVRARERLVADRVWWLPTVRPNGQPQTSGAGTPGPDRHGGYLAKYGDWVDEQLGGAVKMAEACNMPIRIRPVRGLAFGA